MYPSPNWPCIHVWMSWIKIFWAQRALEKATSSCPWENTGSGKYIPNSSKVCPCDLFIVIEYDNLSGNWILSSMKGRLASDDASLTLGIKTRSPCLFPVSISASITWSCNYTTISLVPLQRPRCTSRFLSSITIEFGLRMSLWGGIPDGVRLFKNSIG